MTQPSIYMLSRIAKFRNIPGWDDFILWLRASHNDLVDGLHTAPDADLPGLKREACLLRDILHTLETAEETVIAADANKEAI